MELTMNIDAAVDTLVTALRKQERQLTHVAADGGAPIDVAGELIASLGEVETYSATEVEVLIKSADELIDRLLGPKGFEPISEEEGNIHPLPISWLKKTYVRPAEFTVFDAIDRGDPVVMISTYEAKRFAKQIVQRYGSTGMARPVFIWTSGSGLFEVLGKLPEARFRHVADDGISVRLLSQSLDTHDSSALQDARAELSERQMHRQAFPMPDGPELHIWVDRHSSGNGEPELVIDDFDDNGEVHQIDPEYIALLVAATKEMLFPDNRAGNKLDVFMGMKARSQEISVFGDMLHLITERRLPNAIYILHDSHRYLEGSRDPTTAMNVAVVKDANTRLRRAGTGTQIVLVGMDFLEPPDLAAEIASIDLPLPNRRELTRTFRLRLPHRCGSTLDVGDELLRLVDAAAGMTLTDVHAALRRVDQPEAVALDELTEALHTTKYRALKRSPALQMVDLRQHEKVELGGMEEFTCWLSRRKKVFEQPGKARCAGIDRPPKGVLLLGIPGTGKSLAAHVIAREWKLPLVRLDMGALRDKWVGSSEERVRTALAVVEAMAPCVLWIDEIDKGLAGKEDHSVDLNTRASLLTWLQECQAPVFTVATANRFENLPPELTRAGRFDARFFFGCPDPNGRRSILDIHLRAHGQDPSCFDDEEMKALVDICHGFTGAELEQLVLDALYCAFDADRPLNIADLQQSARMTKPLVKAVGKGLEEAWNLIERGRVELASKHFLSRSQLQMLIDPTLYFPMYCRKENIGGWEKQSDQADRILMSYRGGGGVAVVLDTGDPNWLFVKTNIRYDLRDQHDFKFLDTVEEIARNSVMEELVVNYGIDAILFETPRLQELFTSNEAFKPYKDYFHLAPQKSTNLH
jgi:SpoVK/Ycf46/Vps4 family AAA+-type ATPase